MDGSVLTAEMKQLEASCAYYRKKRTVIALLRFLAVSYTHLKRVITVMCLILSPALRPAESAASWLKH